MVNNIQISPMAVWALILNRTYCINARFPVRTTALGKLMLVQLSQLSGGSSVS